LMQIEVVIVIDICRVEKSCNSEREW